MIKVTELPKDYIDTMGITYANSDNYALYENGEIKAISPSETTLLEIKTKIEGKAS